MTRSVAVAPRAKSLVAWFALTIYLFHMPLLALLHDILHIDGAVLLAAMVPLIWASACRPSTGGRSGARAWKDWPYG